MLDIAHTKYNMSFGVLTNGSMLHKIQDVLVDYGSYCRVSLESACEETFNVYKRPKSADASFPRVINNVRNLVIARNEASSKLQVGYKFSLDKNNWRDISKAFPLAMELGVDSLQFKRIRNVPSELNAIETVRAMKIIMEGVRQYPNLRVLGVDLQPTVLECGCWLTPIHLLVDPEGYVALCCYYRQRPDWRETHCLGNMFKESLRELWYSQKHWDVLKKIDSRECNKYDCRFHYYNKLMRDLVVDGVGQLDFI
jgi:MoaA/NifB/PqqE/SkfB family radical SAM enzyme